MHKMNPAHHFHAPYAEGVPQNGGMTTCPSGYPPEHSPITQGAPLTRRPWARSTTASRQRDRLTVHANGLIHGTNIATTTRATSPGLSPSHVSPIDPRQRIDFLKQLTSMSIRGVTPTSTAVAGKTKCVGLLISYAILPVNSFPSDATPDIAPSHNVSFVFECRSPPLVVSFRPACQRPGWNPVGVFWQRMVAGYRLDMTGTNERRSLPTSCEKLEMSTRPGTKRMVNVCGLGVSVPAFGRMKRLPYCRTHLKRPSMLGLLAVCRSQWYTRLCGALRALPLRGDNRSNSVNGYEPVRQTGPDDRLTTNHLQGAGSQCRRSSSPRA